MTFSSRHLFAACVVSSITTLWLLGHLQRRQDAPADVAATRPDCHPKPRIVWHKAPKGGVLG